MIRPQSDTVEYWYRVTDERRANWNPYDDDGGGGYTVYVYLYKYRVVKHTPKGVQLDVGMYSRPRLVLHASLNKFASPTIAEAIAAFTARKNAQSRILARRLYDVKTAKHLAATGRIQGLPEDFEHDFEQENTYD